ncbi:hypothetical protein [Xinfangfangia pollutisoli]|uniref:hypothetical protein n=1 Tax=Xinfangfangia pollutisoli TaxID=2865960 RepID=UPI001CD3CC15|nr:hypothetical protein [Xinfangfangia pollutisoli]
MIPPLRTLLIALWVACVAGAAVIAGLVLGYYSWATFAVAGVAGLLIGVPAALANWVHLRPKRAQDLGYHLTSQMG